MKVIVCCKCGDTPKFSEESFHLLYKGEETPNIVANKEEIRSLAAQTAGTAKTYLTGYANTEGKFSYFIEYGDTGTIIRLANLLTGKKVK